MQMLVNLEFKSRIPQLIQEFQQLNTENSGHGPDHCFTRQPTPMDYSEFKI